MRRNLYKIQRMNLEADFLERGDSMKPNAHAKFEETIKKMADEEARYAREKGDIEREARKTEHERDTYKRKDPYFDFAEALLQISIVMASIAILSSSRPIFFFSLIVRRGSALFLPSTDLPWSFVFPSLGKWRRAYWKEGPRCDISGACPFSPAPIIDHGHAPW